MPTWCRDAGPKAERYGDLASSSKSLERSGVRACSSLVFTQLTVAHGLLQHGSGKRDICKHLKPLVTTGSGAGAWREQYTKEARVLQWGEVADLRALEEKHRGH